MVLHVIHLIPPNASGNRPLLKNRDATIDSYQNPNTKQEIYLIRERQIERILSDNTSINRFVISEAILKCLKLITKNCSHDENGHIVCEIYAVNTDGVFYDKTEIPISKQ